jgi:hypothetical protein
MLQALLGWSTIRHTIGWYRLMSDDSVTGKEKAGVEFFESNNGNNEVATTLAAIEKSLDTLNLSFNIDALDVLQND